jgi:hypothetical protein
VRCDWRPVIRHADRAAHRDKKVGKPSREGASWWPEARAELLSFPAGKHDDVADALALVGQILDKMSTPHVVPAPKPPKILSTDPTKCTVTLPDMFEANERRPISRFVRI